MSEQQINNPCARYQVVDAIGEVIGDNMTWDAADSVITTLGKIYQDRAFEVEPMPNKWMVTDIILGGVTVIKGDWQRLNVYSSIELLKGYDATLEQSDCNRDVWAYHDFLHMTVWYQPSHHDDRLIENEIQSGESNVMVVTTNEDSIDAISKFGTGNKATVYRLVDADLMHFSKEVIDC